MAFYGMQMLCLPRHGDQKEVRSSKCLQRGKTPSLFILLLAIFFSFTMDATFKNQKSLDFSGIIGIGILKVLIFWSKN